MARRDKYGHLPFCRRLNVFRSRLLKSPLLSRDNQVWWHAETNFGHPHHLCYLETIKSDGERRQNLVIRTTFAIQRQSSLMARGYKLWSSAPFLPSGDKRVQWHAETNYGHLHLLYYPETIKSDGTRRQIMVILTLFAIQRQSSSMAREDKLWSSTPSSLSRDKRVWWHVETNYGHPHPFCYPETSSPMACRDHYGHLHPSPSKDNRVWWHTETIMVICTLRHPDTIESDGTRRQIMVICTLFAIQRQVSLTEHRDKLWLSTPFLLSRDNRVRWHAKTIMVIRFFFRIF